MLGNLTDAVLLVALGLGYIVCYLANREEKSLKSFGLAVGAFIITLSAIIIISNVLLTMRVASIMGCNMGKAKMQHKMMQPGRAQVPMHK